MSKPNVVTFVTYTVDRRFLAQVRGFVTPMGNPVKSAGFFSINGGLMKTISEYEDLAREMTEELGVPFTAAEMSEVTEKIGDVYDPENDRTNHVYRVLPGYETLLNQRCSTLEDAIVVFLNPEGIARAALWREDLDAIIGEGRLTGISQLILERFPQLLPPTRPRADIDD